MRISSFLSVFYLQRHRVFQFSSTDNKIGLILQQTWFLPEKELNGQNAFYQQYCVCLQFIDLLVSTLCLNYQNFNKLTCSFSIAFNDFEHKYLYNYNVIKRTDSLSRKKGVLLKYLILLNEVEVFPILS